MHHDWMEKWWMDRKRLLQLVVVGYCLSRCVSQEDWSLGGGHGMDSYSWEDG